MNLKKTIDTAEIAGEIPAQTCVYVYEQHIVEDESSRITWLKVENKVGLMGWVMKTDDTFVVSPQLANNPQISEGTFPQLANNPQISEGTFLIFFVLKPKKPSQKPKTKIS